MPPWLERLIVIYIITRALGGVSLFLLVAYLIIRDIA